MNPIASLLCLLVAVASLCATASATEVERNLQFGEEPDFFLPDVDLCDNNDDPNGRALLGRCDTSRFPDCGGDIICYNRKPARDQFWPDIHQPVFFIQYDRVLCYPRAWNACSSCTPGRYCKSEKRCILDENDYPCAEWI